MKFKKVDTRSESERNIELAETIIAQITATAVSAPDTDNVIPFRLPASPGSAQSLAPTFTQRRVEQTIDLESFFGVDFSNNSSLKQAIGGAIIERIRERTRGGEGMSFSGSRSRKVKLKSPYSDEYTDSLDFKAFGKSRGNVNMTLTGDMLGLMDIKRETANSITIGWNDVTENAKAYNHSVGDTVPRRPFFGVNKTELQQIKKEFSLEIKAAQDSQNREREEAFDSRISALLAPTQSVDQEVS